LGRKYPQIRYCLFGLERQFIPANGNEARGALHRLYLHSKRNLKNHNKVKKKPKPTKPAQNKEKE